MSTSWRKHASERIGDFAVFSLRRDVVESPRTSARLSVYVLEAPAWVNVVPVTPAGDMVLIEQFRHGIETPCLEIPGGMVDGAESPAEAAARELFEETGYRAEALHPLGVSHPNPAILNNVLHSYVATGARRVAEPRLDSSEDISVVIYPLERVQELVRDGRITHALVLAAFHFLSLRRNG